MRSRRVAVIGGAGTGKTLLAIEKAERLAREGFRTLLTCFNEPLGDYLKAAVDSFPGLVVGSFHKVCMEHAREAGIALPVFEGKPPQDYFRETLPDIAILTGRGRETSSLAGLEQIGAWHLTHNQAIDPSSVLLESIYRFKGLERPVVILVEIDDRLEKDDLMYVGVTRARSHLVIVGTDATLAALDRRDGR